MSTSAPSLDDVFNTPSLFLLFRNYLISRHGETTLDFLRELLAFSRLCLPEPDLLQIARLLIWRHVPDFSEGYVRLSTAEKRRLINAVVRDPEEMTPSFFARAQSEARASIITAFNDWVATEEWKNISFTQICGPSFVAALKTPPLALALKKHLAATTDEDSKISLAYDFCEAVFALEQQWKEAETEEEKSAVKAEMEEVLKNTRVKTVLGSDAEKKLPKYLSGKKGVPKFIEAVESYATVFDNAKPFMEWLWKNEWVGVDFQVLTLHQTHDLNGFVVPPTLAAVLTNADLLSNCIPFCTPQMQNALSFLHDVLTFSKNAYEERRAVLIGDDKKSKSKPKSKVDDKVEVDGSGNDDDDDGKSKPKSKSKSKSKSKDDDVSKEAEMEVFDVDGFHEPLDAAEKIPLSRVLFGTAQQIYRHYIDEDTAGDCRVLLDPLLVRRLRKSVTGLRAHADFTGDELERAGAYVYHSVCDSWYRELLETLFYTGCSYDNASFAAREAERVFSLSQIPGIATLWLPTTSDICASRELQDSFFSRTFPAQAPLIQDLQDAVLKFRACVSAAERAAEAQNVRALVLLLATALDAGFVRPFNVMFAAAETAGLGEAPSSLFDLPLLLLQRHLLENTYADWLHTLGRANAAALERVQDSQAVPCLCSDFAGAFYSEMCDPAASAERHANLVRRKRLEKEQRDLAAAFFASGGRAADYEDEDLSEYSDSADAEEWSSGSSHSGSDSYADAVEYGLKAPTLGEMLESTYWRRVFGTKYLSLQLVDDELVLWAALNDYFEKFLAVGDAKMAAAQEEMRQAAIRICNRHSACLRNAGPLKSRLVKNCFVSARFFREEEEVLYARFFEDFRKKLISKGFKDTDEHEKEGNNA